VITAGSNLAFKIAAKPLQLETWLLIDSLQELVMTLLHKNKHYGTAKIQ